jgi:hypothetical protein
MILSCWACCKVSGLANSVSHGYRFSDGHDRQVIAENRERLLADAKGLVAEQARP